MAFETLFAQPLKVINVGLPSFHEDLVARGVESLHLRWKPPVEVDQAARDTMRRHRERIDEANARVLDIILGGRPVLTGLSVAREVIPGMHDRLILHSGPPLKWDRMCGPTRGAIMGALVYEGLADSPGEAQRLASSGQVDFAPCHEHASVGPMAGIISASMPVFVVENESSGHKAYCTLNEGLGKVLRYGAYAPGVIERLRWMEKSLYPVLREAVKNLGRLDLSGLMAQALHMGDEVHNRNRAATSLLYRTLAPHIVETAPSRKEAREALDFIHGNDHFFLNLSMPAAKCCLDAARDIPGSSLVVAMARNGTDFGLQLSGTGNTWYTCPAPVPDALFFPGFSKEDANPDIGDSAITETLGLGGFAIAAAPAIVQFVGGKAGDALQYTLDMYEISAGEHKVYQIPQLDFRGSPVGIDVRQVVEKNITPFIDTGVAHKEAGVGQVGAGVLSAPMEVFRKAFQGLAERLVAQ